MSDKANSGAERLGRILDGLAEYIQNAPGDELLEDARGEGRDPAQTTMRVKGLLRQAVKNHQQKQLKRAEEDYEREVAAIKSRVIRLPRTAERRRSLLAAIFMRQPQLKLAFTFQNRGFSELTDEDINNHLRKLALLGVLDEMQLTEDDE
jgi:hypothetical protein